MKKHHFLTLLAGLIVIVLFYFGRTTPQNPISQIQKKENVQAFDVQEYIKKENAQITVYQQSSLKKLEEKLLLCKDSQQKISAFLELSNFYKDSLKIQEGYLYYTSEASKLDNSEKNLTFAAQLFLNILRGEENPAKLEWESNEAILLFQKAIELNPENDDLRIGLGSCYVFGKGRNGDPQQTMKGIQELLAVVRKDSTNMKAQLVLGIGGYVSGQYDKAIARLSKVIIRQPDNLEAIAFLADTYAAKGDAKEAIKWYSVSKRLANDEHYSREVDDRIRLLNKK